MFKLEIFAGESFYEMYFINSDRSSLRDDAQLYLQHWPLFQILIYWYIDKYSEIFS